MDLPLVSVVLPVHNRADVVAESLTSVLEQSYTNLEVIVVDDASTDSSMSEVRRVADDRVTIVHNEGERGAGSARNTGIRRAQGRFLAFQDSDDRWHPDKLALQMRVLTDPQHLGVVAVGCGWRLMQQGIRLRSEVKQPSIGWHHRNDVLDGMLTGVIGTPMLLVDRERCAHSPQFDTGFPSLEERDFVYQFLPDREGALAVVEAELVDVRRGRGDHVANPARTLAGYEMLLTKHAVELAHRPGTVDWYHYAAMREALIMRSTTRARDHLRQIRQRSTRLRLEYALGRVLGYTGLAATARLRLRPRISRVAP